MANLNEHIMRWRELSVDGVRSICPHHDGEWVKFDDIKELLQNRQHLKSEIAAIVAKSVPCCKNGVEWFELGISFAEMERMRQLSAV